jgi:uncharacterized membrane protein
MRKKIMAIWKEFWQTVVRYFVAGVFAILPLVVTVAIVGWVSGFLAGFVGPGTAVGKALSTVGVSVGHNSTLSYVIGWLVVLLAILGGGMVVELGAKKYVSGLMQRLFGRLPLIGSVYRTSQQLVEMLDTSNKDAMQGMSAVYCRFSKEPGPTILALLVSPQRYRIGDRDYLIIIIPTAPVPFGGAMMLFPVEQIEPAGLSVDALMSVYVSMGVTAADHMTLSTVPNVGEQPAGP